MSISQVPIISDNEQLSSYYKVNQTSSVQSTEESSDAIKSNESNNDDAYMLEISDKAMSLSSSDKTTNSELQIDYGKDKSESDTQIIQDKSSDDSTTDTIGEKDLTPSEQEQVNELKSRDTEVRAHEAAHRAAAGSLKTSAPSYTYQTGPDGKQYAIGGEVNITFQQTSDPQENLQNAEAMKAAALAPASPSNQDRSVANQADRIITEAQQQIAQKRAKEAYDTVTQTNASQNETENTPFGKKNNSDTTDLKQSNSNSDNQNTVFAS